MIAIETLKKRSDFLALRSARRFNASAFTLQSRKRSSDGPARVGYTVTTKTGNAVVRNRIKRRLREAVRTIFPQKAKGNHDYVLIGRRDATNTNFAQMLIDLGRALDHVHNKEAKPLRKHGKSDSKNLNRSKPKN